MPFDGGTAVVNVIANASRLSASISAGVAKSEGALAGLGTKLSSALTNPLVIAGGLAAGVTAKLALDFEDAFTRIAAISNASADDIANWRGEVMSLSGETAQAPKELADALFFLASAGLPVDEVMSALEASAKGSAIGLGETADVANVVASAMNAYAKSGLTAVEVTDTLVAAVREGRAEPTEFAAALGRILPIASAAGVTFAEVTASLSGLSNIGLDVDESVTAIRGALQAMVAPGTQAADAMKELGLSAQDLLDSIHEDGLLGAFELLKTRAAAATDTQADYLGVLRKVIPNIRGLTGVLGLSGDELEHNKLLFDQVTHAIGDTNEAFGETKQGAAFQFNKALNEIRITATELGQKILPAITNIVRIIGPALKLAADNAELLLAAFLGFKAATFLVAMLPKLALGLQAIGAASAAQAVQGVAVGLETLGVTLAAATPLALGFAAALTLGTAALVAWDPLGIIADQESFNEALGRGTSEVEGFAGHVAAGRIVLQGAAQTFAETVGQSDALRAAFIGLNSVTVSQREGFTKLSPAVAEAGFHLNKANEQVRNFLGLTSGPKGTLKEFRQNVLGTMSAVAGSVADTGNAWTLSAEQAVKGVARMAAAQTRLARDLKELDKIPVGDKLKGFLLEQGPQAVDAFVKGNKAQRGAIRDSFKVYDQAARETNKAVKDITSTGGQQAGRAFGDGAARGVDASAGAAIAASSRMGHQMVEALNRALGNKSPSKEGIKAGQDLIRGVIVGIERQSEKVKDALQELVPLIRETLGVGAADQARGFLADFTEVERKLKSLTHEFDRLKSKISDFRGAIRGAFSESADLIGTIGDALSQFAEAQAQFVEDTAAFTAAQGPPVEPTAPVAPTAPDLHALIVSQAAQAEQLAKLLKELQQKGLNTALLTQLAGQGAGAIPIAEALLGDPALIEQLNAAQQQIAEITQQTADRLTEVAFGDKVARLGADFDKLQEHFDKLIERLGRFITAIHVQEVNDQTQALVDALKRFVNVLGNWGALPTGPGVPAPGPGGPGPGDGPRPDGQPNIHIHIEGPLIHQNDLPRVIRDALLELKARNVTTGL